MTKIFGKRRKIADAKIKKLASPRKRITLNQILGSSNSAQAKPINKINWKKNFALAKYILNHKLPLKTSIASSMMAVLFGVIAVSQNLGPELIHSRLFEPLNPNGITATLLNYQINGWQNFVAFYQTNLDDGLALLEKQASNSVAFLYSSGSQYSELAGLIETNSESSATPPTPIASNNFKTAPQLEKIVGQVLSANTKAKPTTIKSTTTVVPTNLKNQIQSVLDQYVAEGKFKGPQGEQGPQGQPGQNVMVKNSNVSNTSLLNGVPVITYVQSSTPNNFAGGTIAGFTYLSSNDFISKELTVSNNSNLTNVIVSNNLVAPTATITSLIATNINFSGSLYQNGVPFVNGSASSTWLTSGINTYYSSGNVGIGTSTPTASLSIQQPTTTTTSLEIRYGTHGPAGAFGNDLSDIATSTSIIKIAPTSSDYLPDAGGVYNLLELAHRDRFGSSQGTGGAILFSADNPPASGESQKARIVQYQEISGSTGSALVLQTNRNQIWHPGLTVGFTGNIAMGITLYGSATRYTDPLNSRLLIQGSTADTTANAVTVLNSATSTLFTIRNDGRVGIGTTTLNSALINVAGTSTSPNLDLFDISSSSGASILRVTNAGNVGIGTSTPANKLHLYVNSNDGLKITNTLASSYSTITLNTDNNPNGGQLYYQGSTNAFMGNNNSLVLGSFATNTPIRFVTNSINRMILDIAGNLGINTTTPIAKLSIVNSATTTAPAFDVASSSGTSLFQINAFGAQLFNSSAGTAGQVLQSNGSSAAPTWVATSTLGIAGSLSGGTNGKVAIWTSTSTLSSGIHLDNGTVGGINATSSTTSFLVQGTGSLNPFQINSSTGTSLLTVLANGNVGIGTTTPSQKFVVAGNSYITGFQGVGNGAATSLNGEALRVKGDILLDSPNNTPSLLISSATTTGGYGELDFGFQGLPGGPFVRGFGSDDFLIFGTGQVERARFNSSGNFGIGTTTPAARLSVTGNNSIDPFNISSTSGTSLIRVTSAGNMGIGTTSPQSQLHLYSTGDTRLIIDGATGSNPLLQFRQNNSSVGFIQYNNSGTYLQYSSGTHYFSTGNVGINTSTPQAKLAVQGTAGNNNILDLASSTGVSVLRVTADGNLGIGTTTPGLLLTVGSGFSVNSTGNVTGANFSGGTFTAGSTSIGPSYMNWTSAGNLFQYPGGYLNIVDYIWKSGTTWNSDSYSSGTRGMWVFNQTFGANTTATTTGTGSLEGIRIAPIFGSGSNYEYNSSRPMVGLVVSPRINIRTNSTGGYIGFLVNTIETSTSSTATNYIAQFQSNTSTKLSITAAGFVGIGTTTPSAPLEVFGSGTGAIVAKFTDNNSTGCTLATGGTISCSSDARLKKNIFDINYGLDAIMQLRPVEYNWNYEEDSTTTAKNLGFIAQEVQSVIPKLVTQDPTGQYQLNTTGIVPVLTKAVQQQQISITNLQQTVNNLQNSGSDLASSTTISVQLYLSADSVGQAKILAGQNSVRVSFKNLYQYQPIVTLTSISSFIPGYVTDVDAGGFTIMIDPSDTKHITNDSLFAWHAFAGQAAELTVSDGTNQPIPLVLPAYTNIPSTNSNQNPELPAQEPAISDSTATEPSQTETVQPTDTPTPETTNPLSETVITTSN